MSYYCCECKKIVYSNAGRPQVKKKLAAEICKIMKWEGREFALQNRSLTGEQMEDLIRVLKQIEPVRGGDE